jgi:hypothetical protein
VESVVTADRSRYPHADWPYLRWLTVDHLAGEQAEDCAVALRLMVCSSSLQPIIERCVPAEIAPGVYRIDLRDLHWSIEDWRKVVASYPYSHAKTASGIPDPAIVRGDWLLLQLADASKSDAYYRLMFGGDKIPKTRDDWLKLLDVSTEPGLDDAYRNFGLVEGDSGVAKNKVRWIESRPSGRGYAWGTRDTLAVTTDKDPLEHIDGNYQHDGEEWIVGIEKVSLTTGQRGALQVYLLSDGKGTRVDKAPIDLVEDSSQFRGLREIRNPGSCVQCHDSGLNDFTVNEFRRAVASGVDPYVSKKQLQAALEAFHLADTSRDIKRANEDFAAAVTWSTGKPPIEAAACFKRAVLAYDAPLDLAAAARELGAEPEAWKLSLAHASSSGYRLGARLAGMAHGNTIPREAWEDRYLEARQYWREWESK